MNQIWSVEAGCAVRSAAKKTIKINFDARSVATTTFTFSVTLSVEFADADTAQKAHYRPDTDNQQSVHHYRIHKPSAPSP